jgi:hypothetical protein
VQRFAMIAETALMSSLFKTSSKAIVMTDSAWYFREKKPSDTARDPISSEFFANESVKNAARALVREAIQNSLDARLPEHRDPVEIRINIGVEIEATGKGEADYFFHGVWPHLKAKQSKLQKPPSPKQRCAFLTIEDFGTNGLEGDPEEWKPSEGKDNAFYTFFRAEAYSEKVGEDRGRWGVGKLVFPRSSRASSFFGYTIPRSTGKPMLMGRMILGHHPVDDIEYVPDAFFGVRKTVAGDPNFVIAVTDHATLARFRQVFHVSRDHEPGLSVVVPWLVDATEDLEQFEVQSLSRTVAAEYMLPILRGDLVVKISRGRETQRLDAVALNKADQPWIDDNVRTLLELGRFAANTPSDQIFRLEGADQSPSPKMPETPLASENLAAARTLLESGQAVAFDFPIRVHPKNVPSQLAVFRVHLLANSSSESEAPVFVRDGITITNAKGPRVPEYASLVTVDDNPLASMLGDAENPAHTEWLTETRGFKDKYKYAAAFLRYVKHGPVDLFHLLFSGQREIDLFVLAEFFPDSELSETASQPGKANTAEGRGVKDPPAPPPPPKPRLYSLSRVAGGFQVRRGTIEGKTPHRLRIRIAYDVRTGNPLRKYAEFDFDVAAPPIDIVADGLSVLSYAANEIVAAPDRANFSLAVTGFDENRDLYVKVEAYEDTDEH